MTVPDSLRERVRAAALYRCGYCRVPEVYVYAAMNVDHIIPIAKGGTDAENNLWLSCPRCNNYKNDRTHGIDPQTERTVPLYNPRTQSWSRHFRMINDGVITGRTQVGRATVEALQINLPASVRLRKLLMTAGWKPS